jgi:hypothetical protein
MIKKINATIPKPKMKKSCGQNTLEKRMNLPLGIFNMMNGLPLTRTKGSPKKIRK